MKRNLIQIGIGLLPVLMGFCMSLFAVLPLFLTSLLFLALWAWLCFRFFDPGTSVWGAFLRICLPGTLIIVLAVCQELVPDNNLPGILINASQFYFLTGISLAGRILTPILRVITAWPYYIVSYCMLTLLCLLTLILKKKVA
jgi:hypothetical protein